MGMLAVAVEPIGVIVGAAVEDAEDGDGVQTAK